MGRAAQQLIILDPTGGDLVWNLSDNNKPNSTPQRPAQQQPLRPSLLEPLVLLPTMMLLLMTMMMKK